MTLTALRRLRLRNTACIAEWVSTRPSQQYGDAMTDSPRGREGSAALN
jgi:hypothetical protein